MAVMKCKMCGGDLNVTEGVSVVECEYCGSRQTIPNQDSEKKLTLFARADRLRRANEFDKAAGVYESIVAEFPEEAEAYWGLVLCRYGIEYVDDPATGKKVPTCHRSSFDSILEDADFDQACENADPIARRQYREEAKAIESIRKGILEVSSKEEPYDIFICYKETDENGGRTIDSVIAQDVYDALTEKGYRVFFSRISLEDKLGTEYEPYIFAALNSAKVMLAFGTDFEYFNAVWVKNEWSRFLALMAAGQKKTLIPCYKNLDVYDMPKEFQRLQAQDMGKVGAIQDLLRGIGKIIPKEVVPAPMAVSVPGVEPLLKRGNMALEDSDWTKAKELFDQVLSIDPECAGAYLGMAMADGKCSTQNVFAGAYINGEIDAADKNLRRAKQFGGTELKNWLDEIEPKRKAELQRRKETETAERLRREAAKRAARQRQEEERKRREAEAQEAEALRQKQKEEHLVKLETRRNELSRVSKAAKLISVGSKYVVGLGLGCTVDNAVRKRENPYDVSGWRDIVALAAANDSCIGLKSDGTVAVAGDWKNGGSGVLEWKDIVAVNAGSHCAVGLKSDGTVVSVGYAALATKDQNNQISNWQNIVAVAAGRAHIVGLNRDGTVVATGENKSGQCNVNGWRDIVAVFADGDTTFGLCLDGRVLAAGFHNKGEPNISDWRDIVAVSSSLYHTVGLKSNGTVVTAGGNPDGQCNVSNWTDIVAVATGYRFTIGLKSDGTVKMAGDLAGIRRSQLQSWKLFNSLDTLEQERETAKAERQRQEPERRRQEAEAKAKAEAERQAKIDALNTEKQSLQAELPTLKGLFSGGKRRQIEARLAQIGEELKKL